MDGLAVAFKLPGRAERPAMKLDPSLQPHKFMLDPNAPLFPNPHPDIALLCMGAAGILLFWLAVALCLVVSKATNYTYKAKP